MEQEHAGSGKWKYVLVVICLIGAVGAFAFAKMSSGSARSNSERTTQTAEVQKSISQPEQEVRSNDVGASGSEVKNVANASTTQSGKVYASKNGTKYFTEGCKAGSRVKDENKIFFDSPQEAEKAGYTLAKNC